MTGSLGYDVAGGTGLAFTLARRVAVRLLERSLQERLKVLVEQEVRKALLEQLGSRRQPAGLIQIVVGEVFNITERFDGVVRVGDAIQIEKGAVEIAPLPADDPRLDALVRGAQHRLNSVAATDQADALPAMFPDAEQQGDPVAPIPAFDADQRLDTEAADRYKHRLELLAQEDQVR